MKHLPQLLVATLIGAAALAPTPPVAAQDKPTTAIVSTYRVAPGQHMEFLKWMAAREAADREAGIPATQWYTHMSGDSWDYLAIAPDPDDAMSDKADAAANKAGLTTGMRASLEFRKLMAAHADTTAAGPYTAQQLVDEAGK